jgi:hypothetical protein
MDLSVEIMLADESAVPVILHVEVKLSDSAEESYITVIIWTCTADNSLIQIVNETEYPVVIHQSRSDASKSADIISRYAHYETCVLPGSLAGFGWAEPSAQEKSIILLVGITR